MFITRTFRIGQRNVHCEVVRITTKWLLGLSLDCNGVFAIKAYCGTNDAFGEHLTTAFTGAARLIDARLASEISPKKKKNYNESRFLSSVSILKP